MPPFELHHHFLPQIEGVFEMPSNLPCISRATVLFKFYVPEILTYDPINANNLLLTFCLTCNPFA